MCTILYLYGVHPELPLIVAANRDEFYARSATPPQLVSAAPRAIAGVDRRAGGSWLGVNEHGLMVGLTNQRTFRAPDPNARSRGEVVRAALTAASADELAERLSALEPRAYNGFNLLFGTSERLYAAYFRPEHERPLIEAAPRGVHVLPNDRIGAPGFPRADRALALAQPLVALPWPELQPALARLLGDHELPDFASVPEPPPHASIDRVHLWRSGAICTHGQLYGTCSATLLALGREGVHSHLHADGPPCRTPFFEYRQLLRA